MERQIRACAVDAVVVEEGTLLLILRKFEPFKSHWCLPGGFVDFDETAEQAVIREVKEETGIEVDVRILAGAYSEPARDPRQNISLVYLCNVVGGALCDSEETHADWWSLEALPSYIGFDHEKIISDILP